MEICTLVARVYVRISIVVSGVRLKYLGEIYTKKIFSERTFLAGTLKRRALAKFMSYPEQKWQTVTYSKTSESPEKNATTPTIFS